MAETTYAQPSTSALPARLLPWTASDGKPCYLYGRGGGYVSKMADRVEAEQLDNGYECLDYVNEVLADEEPDMDELLFLVEPMRDALRQVLRVAKSRGERLPDPPYPLEATS
ncbi:hypothetical protein [Streptomyces sp. NPDC005438]|uniref:hypothetical protein n=1 Tax=Streptomyces sp. NPDC005438 TaxID=3156880 RepID=UPI00339EAC2A